MKILTLIKDGKRVDFALNKVGTSEGAIKGWDTPVRGVTWHCWRSGQER